MTFESHVRLGVRVACEVGDSGQGYWGVVVKLTGVGVTISE